MISFLGSIPSCSAEEVFLCRLLEIDSIESARKDGSLKFIKDSLATRISSTHELMKLLEDTIDAQTTKIECVAQALHGKSSAEGQEKPLCEVNCLFIIFHFPSH